MTDDLNPIRRWLHGNTLLTVPPSSLTSTWPPPYIALTTRFSDGPLVRIKKTELTHRIHIPESYCDS